MNNDPDDLQRPDRHRVRSALHKHGYQTRPLLMNTAALATSIGAHEVSPAVGAILGVSAGAVTFVNAWLGRMSDAEARTTVWHGVSAGVWAAMAGVTGFNAVTAVTGGVGAIASHLVWADRRKTRKPPLRERPMYDDWNNPEDGILVRVGHNGVRLKQHQPMFNEDKERVGDRYHLDLSDSKSSADSIIASCHDIARALPGVTRKGSVEAFENPANVNHVVVEHTWSQEWSLDKPVLHPVVQHLPQLQGLVRDAIEHHQSGGAVPERPIPAHLVALMPGMDSIREPVMIGLDKKRKPVYETIFKRKHGTRHTYGVGFTGSGKTSRINCEICSLLPKRDVLIWAIDVSAKHGKHFRPWGSCIDWLATTPKEARAMLQAIVDIANARGVHYDKAAVVGPRTAPIIRVIIDEFAALYDALAGTDVFGFLSVLTKQCRSQGISLEFWTQRANQTDHGYGFQSIVAQCHNRVLMKVRAITETKGVLESHDLVQVDPTTFVPGEHLMEDAEPDNAEAAGLLHARSFLVREADDDPEDGSELDPGDIPAIAAFYAPYRPKLDPISAKAAGQAYAERQINVPENPLVTPEEVMTPRVPTPPIPADERDEVIQRLSTNTNWLDAWLAGRLTVGNTTIMTEEGPMNDTTTGDEDEDLPRLDFNGIFAEQDIPLGDSPMAREGRADKFAQMVQNATNDVDVDELKRNVDALEPGVPLTTVADEAPPKQYPDDDPIVVAAMETIGKFAGEGAAMSDLVEAAGKKLGKKVSDETVRARMRDLVYRGVSIAAGRGRGFKYYTRHHAPQIDSKELQTTQEGTQ